MHPRLLCVAFLGSLLLTAIAPAQSAREYFNELYAAGGLDRMADGHVCFNDDPENANFFIFGRSETLLFFFQENHAFSKLPKPEQQKLKKGFLVVRGYNKGIPFDGEDFYDKDGSSWVTDKFLLGKTPARTRLTIAWETLRYKKTVEILNADSSVKSEVSAFGRCEEVPSTVQQKGN